MFHRYVLAHNARKVDFDRASYLMDAGLKAQAEGASDKRRGSHLQFVWDYYCARHFEKYGSSFQPHADPSWDQRPSP